MRDRTIRHRGARLVASWADTELRAAAEQACAEFLKPEAE